MVLRSQRDGLGSSSQAPRGRTSGTRGDIDVPAVGQRSGAQGPDSKGRASRSGVWVCGATLTWLHGWAGGAGEGIASSDRTLLPTGEERGGWECGDGVSRTAILALLGPGEKGTCSYEVLGTTGPGGLQPAVGLETAADRRGRMWRNASVCFCAAENCWAKSSTASPNRPAWEIGESRKRCLSDSLISAKVSHRWRSWTTNVDIVWPRARAVTFVALSARSVAVRSSCNTPGSASPSCSCFNALAWWTCRRAMACSLAVAPPSRVVRTEEALGLLRAEKGAFQDLVTSSCTSGKNGTGGGCQRSACALRNQSSSLERSGEGGRL